MSTLVAAPWLGFALPILLALVVVVLGRVSKALVPWVAMLAPHTVLGIGVGSLAVAIHEPAVEPPWTSV
ncbi:MAG: hypothetical protein P4L93_04720, partial [Coriobacteriia bacterium]|nr:hypothetical protein [Coriobacteriia bacterium]